MIDPDELAAWLRLTRTPGVSRAAARALLLAFGSPEAVLDASTAARGRVVRKDAAEALATPPEGFGDLLARTRAWLDAGEAPSAAAGRPDAAIRDVIVLGDPRYPPALLESPDPPLLLHLRGRAELLARPSIAIVGSRHATPQGLDNARAFAAHLSSSGWTIVSGLALGIDAAAHAGALGGAGSTIAVVGTGLDVIYPSRHRALTERIAAEGTIVSEFALGTPGLAEHFPIRNRIIAGLARGTLVVEAAPASGSLVTARLASEAGRDVFAIPGSIHSPQSRGCHALIKQGAKLVDAAADIVDELGGAASVAKATASATATATTTTTTTAKVTASEVERDDPILDAMAHDPIDLDALVARTGRSAAELAARLLELELAGRVGRLPGNRFQRLGRA